MSFGSPFERKDVVLTKKLNNVLYELMVKTNSDMVYVSDRVTLTEKLCEFTDKLFSDDTRIQGLENAYHKLVVGAPATFQTFKEVWDYVNINGNPKSELIKLIESKEAHVEGKGLSTHDLTDILYEKLVNDYTAEELNEKFHDINVKFGTVEEKVEHLEENVTGIREDLDDLTDRVEVLEKTPNVPVTAEFPMSLKNSDCYFQIVSED